MARRNRITTVGRLEQGRGEGEGPSFTPWVKLTDFPGRGWGSLINCYVSKRAAHALSDPETRLRLMMEWRGAKDLRENFNLPLEETLEIASELGKSHPMENANEPMVLTLDLLEDCLDEAKQEIQEAHDFKLSKAFAEARVMAEIDIKAEYCRRHRIKYTVWTEEEIDRVLTDNLIHIRFYHEVDDFPTVTSERLRFMEPVLYNELSSSDLPISYACLEVDRRCGFRLGTCLCMVYQLICKRVWDIDLSSPLVPDERVLEILGRNPEAIDHD